MPIYRDAMERRRARDGAKAAVLGTPPADEFGSLRLKWECTDYDSNGLITRYECDCVDGWRVYRNGASWVVVSARGAFERGPSGRHRLFRSARAACKFIEDTKVQA